MVGVDFSEDFQSSVLAVRQTAHPPPAHPRPWGTAGKGYSLRQRLARFFKQPKRQPLQTIQMANKNLSHTPTSRRIIFNAKIAGFADAN